MEAGGTRAGYEALQGRAFERWVGGVPRGGRNAWNPVTTGDVQATWRCAQLALGSGALRCHPGVAAGTAALWAGSLSAPRQPPMPAQHSGFPPGHLISPPALMHREIEAQRGREACPKSHSKGGMQTLAGTMPGLQPPSILLLNSALWTVGRGTPRTLPHHGFWQG